MAEFHHWDFVDEFTAEQAAALILGIDPASLTEAEREKLKPVFSRIHDCYQNALNYYIADIDPQKESIREILVSKAIASALDSDIEPETWPKRKEITDFEQQKFTREALNQWLGKHRLKTRYKFIREDDFSITTSEKSGHWPWGNYNTKLLEHLEAAAKEFWADYKNDHMAAPMNKVVVHWLIENRKVSEVMAKAIASILRADGISPGPKKKS